MYICIHSSVLCRGNVFDWYWFIIFWYSVVNNKSLQEILHHLFYGMTLHLPFRLSAFDDASFCRPHLFCWPYSRPYGDVPSLLSPVFSICYLIDLSFLFIDGTVIPLRSSITFNYRWPCLPTVPSHLFHISYGTFLFVPRFPAVDAFSLSVWSDGH